MNRIYTPRPGEPMKVAFMFSGGATGLKTTIEDNPLNRELYDVDFCFTNKPDCKGANIARDYGISLEVLEYGKYKERYPDIEKRRKAYFSDVNNIMNDAGPDVIVTSGFMLIAVDPFVSDWYGRIMNGHPAKTYVLAGPKGDMVSVGDMQSEKVEREFHQKGYKRKFIGDNAVYDAVVAGQNEVKTAVFFP